MLFKVCHLYAGCSSAVHWIGYLFERAQVIHSKESVSFANGSGYAFETELQPFEQLKLSVQKKITIPIVSLFERLELPL